MTDTFPRVSDEAIADLRSRLDRFRGVPQLAGNADR